MDHDIADLFRLFESQYGLMLTVARRYAPAPDLTYDIVQKTFIAFVEAFRKGETDLETDIRPLLHRITKNIAVPLWREEQRQKTATKRFFDEKWLRKQASEATSRESEAREIAVQEAMIRFLKECLETLPEKSRQLLEQHYYLKIPMEEIARMEKNNSSAIRQIFSRIRSKVRQCIERKVKEHE